LANDPNSKKICVVQRVMVAVLGPLEVRVDGRPVCLAPMEQALLVALLARANQVVTGDRLIGQLWHDPSSMPSRNALHALVRRLRRAIGEGICHTRGSGYLLSVEPGQLDLHRFETLTGEAGQAVAAGDLPRAAAYLQAALALWRGPALAGVPAMPVTTAEAARLEDLHLAALEQRIEVELRLGRHAELAGELTRLVAEHPDREPFYNQLMLALYRSGRRSEALAVYRTLHRRLVDELGLEPGKAAKDLQRAILTGDPVLQPPGKAPDPPPAAAAPAPAGRVPYQLPASSPAFTGRRRELDLLGRLFTEGSPAETVVVAAIYGAAGIGKSALALAAGHRLRADFPGGQLYADLRGGTPGLVAREPGEVLGRLLRSLGVEGRRIPSDLEDRSALYRSLMAGRRALVLLDNAADPAQVRPLLPGTPGGGVLVTSRQILPGLEGATHLHLGVLPPEDAVVLLSRLVGAQRVQAEPAAAAELARLCGYLPLALRIAGARLAGRPRWPLSVLIERLTEQCRRLDELVAGDLAVRSSFQVSYRGLSTTPAGSADQARAFRLLSLLDGPDVGVPAAAALLDRPPVAVEAALERLVDAHLLETPAPGRYRFHDLLRLFARERAAEEEPEQQRTAALVRALGWYLAGAERANRLLCPGEPVPEDTGPHPGLEAFDGRDAALAWLERERVNLLAAAEQLARVPDDLAGRLWRFAEALFCFLDLRGYWSELERVCELALAGARRRGDRLGQAHAHRGLAALAWRRYRLGEALGHLRRSLALFRETGDVRGRARSLNSLGLVRCEQHRYEDAVACYRRALPLFGQAGDRRGEGQAHNNLGEAYRRLGRRDQALDHLGKDLAICRELGDRRGEAITCCNLGEVQRDLGRHGEALDWYRRSLAICHELEDHRGQGINLAGIGDVCLKAGRFEEATGHLRRSIDLLERVGDRHRGADALWRLGLSLDALGDREQARSCWRRAHAIFQEIDAPEAVTVGALVERAGVPG
jgi:DNA-binding SARP family transcriptional activator/Flp pilus assembly protein TadD